MKNNKVVSLQYETTGGHTRKTRPVIETGMSKSGKYKHYESVDGKLLYSVSFLDGYYIPTQSLHPSVIHVNSNGISKVLGTNTIETIINNGVN